MRAKQVHQGLKQAEPPRAPATPTSAFWVSTDTESRWTTMTTTASCNVGPPGAQDLRTPTVTLAIIFRIRVLGVNPNFAAIMLRIAAALRHRSGHEAQQGRQVAEAARGAARRALGGDAEHATRIQAYHNPVPRGRTAGDLFDVTGDDGSLNIFKNFIRNRWVLGGPTTPIAHARREVAAYRVSVLLGFEGLVPHTALAELKHLGAGSVQRFVPGKQGPRPTVHSYPDSQTQEAAVLDYVLASLDRTAGRDANYLIDLNGNLALIDNELSLPTAIRDISRLKSEFVHMHVNQRLNDDVLAKVQALHPEQLRGALHDLEIEPRAINGALDRLQEIQTNERITGAAWRPGEIIPY
ncbi:MAG: hypothetical protein HOQ24_19855 [Mycobacteriaceae bacterium]|nr:hypothetical protein [Mycobacteriaceae bacterium]